MAKKHKVTKVSRVPKARALVPIVMIRETSLTVRQNSIVTAPTPREFIKERTARGGKTAKYVEGGYVINKLNEAFSPVGWDFEIVEQGILDTEVWVKGKIIIKDHKNGYTFSKTQYGQHERHKGTPLGDTLKAAATDSLKKCASMLGIALDVYWKFDQEEGNVTQAKPQPKAKRTEKVTEEEMVKVRKMINTAISVQPLFLMDERVSKSPLYTTEQKNELHKLISKKVDILDSSSK